ncbi:MAG TPA: DPP IV N-terminal domain-containing protein [Nitrospiria bacterium]|nr:DPP IV N-terminal domain-containing protein [Nitrospiria bacterium]
MDRCRTMVLGVAAGLFLLPGAAFSEDAVPHKPGPLVASERQLTFDEEEDYLPSFSPDGKRLAYSSYASGNEEIWVMGADGKQARPITDSPKGDWSPAWSPDGKTIVFTSSRDGVNQLWIMGADGSNPKPLTRADPLPSTWSRDPSWSRDGRMIIFTSNRSGKDENWILDLEKGKQWKHSIGMAEHWHPSFSPDGKKVLFSSNMSGEWGLWLSDLEGNNLVRLVADKRFDNNPAASWSPDGEKIVFRTAFSDLWIMDSDGKNVSALTTDGTVAGWRPAWSPDSKKIAYTSLRSGNSDIWMINLK